MKLLQTAAVLFAFKPTYSNNPSESSVVQCTFNPNRVSELSFLNPSSFHFGSESFIVTELRDMCNVSDEVDEIKKTDCREYLEHKIDWEKCSGEVIKYAGADYLQVGSWNESYIDCQQTRKDIMTVTSDPLSLQFTVRNFFEYRVNEATSSAGNLLEQEFYIDMSDQIDPGLVSFCRSSDGTLTSRSILVPISDQLCSDIFLKIDVADKYYQLEDGYSEFESDLDCTNQGDVNAEAIQGLIRKRRENLKKIRDLKLYLNILLFVSSTCLLVFFCKDKIQNTFLHVRSLVSPSPEDNGYAPVLEMT